MWQQHGGEPGVDFVPADASSTGQILQFRVVPAAEPDPTTPPAFLALPAIAPLPTASKTRPLALLEEVSTTVDDAPVEARLGTIEGDPNTGVRVAKPRG